MAELPNWLTGDLGPRYTITGRAGAGGMSIVYLAEDLKYHRPVAIKVLRPEYTRSLATERFLQEIEIAARLNHPNILPLLDSGDLDGVPYYVMPFVDGETLRDRIDRDEGLPIDDARRLTEEIVEAVGAAHRQGVIHRDIKPENVMLRDGHAIVVDFGIARALQAASAERITGSGAAVGTRGYMSPEQAMGDPRIDGRTDIFSIGCVLYEMLVGVPPRSDETGINGEPSHPILTARGPVPDDLEQVIHKALAAAPQDRFQTADELRKALTEIPARGRNPRPGRWVALVAVVAAFLLIRNLTGFGSAADPLFANTDSNRLAVMPFETSGSITEGFDHGIVSLLAANLDGVGTIQTVSPRSVASAWRRAGPDLDFPTMLALARDLEADAVLLGSVVEAGATVRISASLYGADGSRHHRVEASGPMDSLLHVVDTLSLRLIRSVWKTESPAPSLRAEVFSTGAIGALRDHLAGEQALAQADWTRACARFRSAIEADAAFALAHFRLSECTGWTTPWASAEELAALDTAYQHRHRLPAPERSLVTARFLDKQGVLAAVDTMKAYVDRHPYDAEGWYYLGDIAFHTLSVGPEIHSSILDAFDRAWQLSPTMTRAIIHPLHLTAMTGDSVGYHRYLDRLPGSTVDANRFLDWGSVLWGTPRDARAALGRVLGMLPLNLNGPFLYGLIRSGRLSIEDVGEEFDRAIERLSPQDPLRTALERQRAKFFMAHGRFADAARSLDYLWQTNRSLAIPLLFHEVMITGRRTPAATRAARFMEDSAATVPRVALPIAWYHLSLGEVQSAREWFERFPNPGNPQTDQMLGLRQATRGWIDLMEGDTLGGLARMESGLTRVGYGTSARAIWTAFELALTTSAPHREQSVAALRYALSDIEFAAPRLVALGNALEQLGRPAEAREVHATARYLWREADGPLRDRLNPP